MVINFRQNDKDNRPFVDVPVPDMAIKFYLLEYGEGHEYIHARLNGFLGGVILMICEKQPFRQIKLKKKLPMKKLRVMLPDEYRASTVREEMVVALGQHLEAFFRQQFLSYVNGAFDLGSSVNAAVKAFLDKYKINDDEWSNDTARRYYRHFSE